MAISAPEILAAGHNLSAFDCGKASLNAWLTTHALRNQERGFTVVMVVHEDSRVVGFYGLSPTAIEPALLPRKVRTGQPPNPIGCLLMGQLATDRSYAGRGIGMGLVKHALERAVLSAQITGGRALLVNAVDDEARAFWKRRGFLETPSDPYLLFRPMQDIEASLRGARGG